MKKKFIMAICFFSSISGIGSVPQVKDMEDMIKAATLAPSGHNAQPWKFKVYPSSIEIYPDFTKALPVVDPDNRELYISLGCAAENLILAANAKGYDADFSIEAESRDCFYIRINLSMDEPYYDELCDEIPKRQTNRALFCGAPIPAETLNIMSTEIRYPGTSHYVFTGESREFRDLSGLIEEGNDAQMRDEFFKEELVKWIRFNKKQKESYADGLSYDVMGTPAVPAAIGRRMLRLFLTPHMQNKTDRKKLKASSNLVLLTVMEDNPKHWILLGRNLERYLLSASLHGVAYAFNNQPCEVHTLTKKVQDATNIRNEIPVILLRMGYAKPAAYATRINASDLVEYIVP